MNLEVVTCLALIPVGMADQDGGVRPSELGTGLAVMLVGWVVFQMSCSFLFNHPDQDMRRYSHEILFHVISMFNAIMILQAFDMLIQKYVSGGGSSEFRFCTYTVQMLFLFVVLQIQQKNEGKKDKLNAKCFGVLVSNMVGLSAINVWCTLQRFQIFESSALSSLFVVPIAALTHIILMFISEWVRAQIVGSECDEAKKMWGETVKKGENDATSFALSFMLVQSLCYATCGSLPDTLGILTHCDGNEAAMLSLGMVISSVLAIPASFVSENRPMAVISCTLFSFSAWCLTFASVAMTSSLLSISDKMVLATVTVLFITFISVLGISFADKIADSDATSEKCDAALMKLIMLFGICVTLAWVQCFRVAVSELYSPGEPMWIPFGVLIVIFTQTVPAWRFYIAGALELQYAQGELRQELLDGERGGEGTQ